MAHETPDVDQPTPFTAAPLVRMRQITKQFPGVLALNEVGLELRAGEIHALAGENGSGKSTLAKILYGALLQDAGVVELDGEVVALGTPARALEHGIVAISQELTLAPTLSVTENVLMGRLPLRRGLVDWTEARSQARAALDSLGVQVDERTRVGDLSIELQQEVEVARAISANSRVLILDEATSSLSEAATDRLLEKLEQLRQRGLAILFISHRLRELYTCAQRCTVLRDGVLVGTVSLAETDESELVRMMVGREISDLFGKRRIERGEPRLIVAGLTTEDGSVEDASFEVRKGEIVGIAGLVGSGKSELALALAGAVPASGWARIDGKIADLRSPRRAIRSGMGFVPEDRKGSAIFPTRTVRHNLSHAWMRFLARLGFVSPRLERQHAVETVEKFSVRTPTIERSIVQLSGGNQQKVVLGRTFALSPDVIVLAEPTRGIDVGAKSEVYRFIQGMAEEGAAVVLSSSELPELLGVADRILVMFRGRITGEFDARQADEETLAHAAFGGVAVGEAAS